jgi:hypothetical protein
VSSEQQAAIKQAANWLRRQANAETDAKARAAFIEAHNAILSMCPATPAASAALGELQGKARKLKDHAWLERFRKANYENKYNELSPSACNDIAWYVDAFVDAVLKSHAPLSAEERSELERLRAEIKLWRPMTAEEAEAELDAIEAEPLDEAEIERIVAQVTDPTYRPTEPQHVLMAAKIRQLTAQLAAVAKERDGLRGALNALADKVDATSECDHKRRSCEEIGCVGAEVKKARAALAQAADAERADQLEATLRKVREYASELKQTALKLYTPWSNPEPYNDSVVREDRQRHFERIASELKKLLEGGE